MKKKHDAAACIMEWKCVAENQSKTKLLILRLDNGGRFTSTAFKSQMALHGVVFQTTPTSFHMSRDSSSNESPSEYDTSD